MFIASGLIGWQQIVAILVVIFAISLVIWCCLWKRTELKKFLGLNHEFILDGDNKIIKVSVYRVVGVNEGVARGKDLP